jgi:hypothetical protein
MLALGLCGCATLTRGSIQQVAIDTPGVTGAACTLTSEGIGEVKVVTPTAVALGKSRHDVAVRCRKECFQDGVGLIKSEPDVTALGNVIVGGVPGIAVDLVSGAANQYSPGATIHMAPVPGCRQRLAGQT